MKFMRSGLPTGAALTIAALLLSACGGGGGGSVTPNPTPTPTPIPTPTPGTGTLLCTSGGAPQSIAVRSTENVTHRSVLIARGDYAPGKLEVFFERSAYASAGSQLNSLFSRASAQRDRAIDFAATDRVVQLVDVPAGQEQSAIAQLRASSLVKSVSRVAYRSKLSTTASSTFTNDPYFQGFTGANTPPLYEAASTPGEWDLHEICAANAWAYGNSNTTGRTIAGALGGASSFPVAIIDTGADLTHPELSGRVTYAESDLNGSTTSGLAGMHDNDGHGTDVAGIVGAAANNSLGFAGVAYAAPLMIFKVFPDPPSGGCPPGSTSSQCTALGSDVALAIAHAVARGAKVINLSLGSSAPDTSEENAVASAIAAGVVVVAASGNETASTLDYPGRDPGVIAVGASALDDSIPTNIVDKVASYSNYDASNPTSWGLVAPGGDPSGTSDVDDLHWIENIYTSTASDGSSTGACKPDFGSSSGPNDCRVLIAGTSQATPHVTGAAALLLSAGASAANIKSILCLTATPVTAGVKAGCGRLNVYKAMAQVVGDPSP